MLQAPVVVWRHVSTQLERKSTLIPFVTLPLQEDIEKVRTVDEQVGRMGVPEEWVDAGHAFHTYTLTSPDGSG